MVAVSVESLCPISESLIRTLQKQFPGVIDVVDSSEAPVVFAKFMRNEILGEMGRLLFFLLDAFSASGYHIKLFDSLAHAALEKYGRLACALPHVTLTNAIPSETSEMIYLFDEEDKSVGTRAWRKKVHVRFDVFSPYWFGQPILMPYPVHPVHAGPDLPDRLRKFRASAKKMRVFFSGDSKGYVTNRIHYPAPKLPRLEVINAILQEMGDKALLVQGEQDLAVLGAAGYVNKCLVMDQDHPRIDETRWLATLATSDFFLCPPGYVMPMCHNGVEAMAVGAIPIINYPEWFDPHLEHLQNCIVFGDKADLLRKMNEVLQMGPERIAQMRQRVIAYYDEHLAPQIFIRKLESSEQQKVIVLMITDANVSKNAAKLNARSVLIRGSSAPGISGWLARRRLS